MTDRSWWPGVLWTGPQGGRRRVPTTVCQFSNWAGPLQPSQRDPGSIMVALWSGGPPRVPNPRIAFFSSLQSGARGEAWLHASDGSCWHARLIKANETAHCSQRMDTGRGSNRPTSTQRRSPRWPPSAPAFISFQHFDTDG